MTSCSWPQHNRSATPPSSLVKPSSLLVLLLTVGTLACGRGLNLSQYPTPEALLEVSLRKFAEGNCGAAETGFESLTLVLPARDPRQAIVRVHLAECSFRRKRYLQATRDYRRVSNEHPQDSLAPRALLRAGEAYARLWRRVELDATHGLSALTTYSELLNRYASSPAAAQAREHITALNEKFAHKEYRTGVFYLRLKAFDSAITSFKTVVADYPQSTFAAEALLKLVQAFDKIGYNEDKNDMCVQLQRFYPEALERAESCPAQNAP